MWARTQGITNNTSTQQLLGQILTLSLNSGDFLCTMLFMVCHLGASMYLHDSLADLPQMLVAKLILQWLDHTYINFQAFSKGKSCYKILQNITRIHLPSALVYFCDTWHCINCGRVCLAQEHSTLNATHCTFTRNVAGVNGGAITAWVGHCVQGVAVLDIRIHQSNHTIFNARSSNCCSFSNRSSLHTILITIFGLE